MSTEDDDEVRTFLVKSDGCSCCAGTPADQPGGNTAIDPVCGMTVSPTEATPTSTHDGQVHYFCAPSCRRAFERDPQAYAPTVPGLTQTSG